MYIDIFILVLLVGSILGLSVAILFIVSVYSHMTKKIEETEKEKILLHTNITQKAENLLSEAHTNNLRIVSEANRKAQAIIEETRENKTASEEILKTKLDRLVALQVQTLDALSSDFLKTYRESLEQIKLQDLEKLKKASSTIEQTVEKELTDFSSALKKETLSVEEEVKERVEQEFAKAKADIEAYKKQELENVKASLYPLLQRTTEIVLGKALSLEDHEALVVNALEEAQKEMSQSYSNYTNMHRVKDDESRSTNQEARNVTVPIHNS